MNWSIQILTAEVTTIYHFYNALFFILIIYFTNAQLILNSWLINPQAFIWFFFWISSLLLQDLYGITFYHHVWNLVYGISEKAFSSLESVFACFSFGSTQSSKKRTVQHHIHNANPTIPFEDGPSSKYIYHFVAK